MFLFSIFVKITVFSWEDRFFLWPNVIDKNVNKAKLFVKRDSLTEQKPVVYKQSLKLILSLVSFVFKSEIVGKSH